jgi:glycosyltransferase involved in cell wall biosynthesis
VIVPTHNRADLISEALDSVWAQIYRPIELLVVDDGSTDNTVEVVQKWGRGCDSDAKFTLRYFRQENRGPAAARNHGLGIVQK